MTTCYVAECNNVALSKTYSGLPVCTFHLQSKIESGGDTINHPPHYTHGNIETIDVIEAWKLGFCLGNAIKYISRAGHKGEALQDLKKARWYLDREIARMEREGA